ncbi:MAG TPA: type II toxin-antitoxin system RatA family toxin [Gammaproteobacteria bacterium]|nr:type II toxin-antitoxin system RatA family toxin [Gammaproteobacteria bacterium]
MQQVRKSAIVPYSPRDMYNLVADIESYPQFLPWCTTARVLGRQGNEVTARLTLVKAGMHHDFTTRNTMREDSRIDMHLVEGPFKSLRGCWRFEPVAQGTLVTLDLHFELASKLLAMTLGRTFQKVNSTLVDAFSQRAAQLYGRR